MRKFKNILMLFTLVLSMLLVVGCKKLTTKTTAKPSNNQTSATVTTQPTQPSQGSSSSSSATQPTQPTEAPHTHTLTHHDAVNGTCTTKGTIEYWDCTCGCKYEKV